MMDDVDDGKKRWRLGRKNAVARVPIFDFLFYVRSVGSATDRKISRHLSIARDNKTQGVRRLISARNPPKACWAVLAVCREVSLIVIFVQHRIACHAVHAI